MNIGFVMDFMTAPRRIVLALLALSLLACASSAPQSRLSACIRPPAGEGWQVAEPSDQGFDSEQLCRAIQQAIAGRNNIHSIVIERRGYLLSENYFAGLDSPLNRSGVSLPFKSETLFNRQLMHDTRSISKSIVGLVFGIVQDKKKYPLLETPVLDSFPELAYLRTQGREQIQFKHLLSMTSGLVWDEWGRGFFGSDETNLYWLKDATSFTMNRPVFMPPGQHFNYSAGNTMVIAEALKRSTTLAIDQLAEQHLFNPLGITQFEWLDNWQGQNLSFSGLKMLPRDMLKIGRLINTKGRWRGQQVVSQQWLELMLSPHTEARGGDDMFGLAKQKVSYGYHWWLGQLPWQGRMLSWAAAIGNGGQRIVVVPELELSIVTTAGEYGSGAIQRQISQLVEAIVSTVKEPLNNPQLSHSTQK